MRSERTVFHDRHVALGAQMVDFGGWDMPLAYPSGIVAEHLATRKDAGLFDVSHMGRFRLRGADAPAFLQRVLTSNVAALDPREQGAQYAFIANPAGGAVDDAYLYHFEPGEYLLVVNAANRERDWAHLQALRAGFADLELVDRTREIVMLALQGPASRSLLEGLLESGALPEPRRNRVGLACVGGVPARLARTGYTGEPLGFELFAAREEGPRLWDALVAAGATPVGLGARDTLRLEAGLPLYGQELGLDPAGGEIPILALSTFRFAVSFSPLKGDFVGREALARQQAALVGILDRDYRLRADLPRLVQPLALADRGLARAGTPVYRGEQPVGWVTSGTRVPYWELEGEGLDARPGERHGLRSIALAYLDCDLLEDAPLWLELRGRRVAARIVPYHLRGEAPPYARPIIHDHPAEPEERATADPPAALRRLLTETLENGRWRQRDCINLIPSEMTLSPLARLASVMDPAFRYGEHRPLPAFYEAEVFYYQGVDFIRSVEARLEAELRAYLGCPQVETRLVSGQMANTVVFSAMVDFLNRSDRKAEPRRMRRVMNHDLGKGGHLSAQPMGALRDCVARDPRTERPAVSHFPVRADNPYRIDLPATLQRIEAEQPELIVLGKSVILHPEPVAEIRAFLDDTGIASVLMVDMAHVLGLVGPHFQDPFAEGADLVTGSTHKTFFGTQRGIVAGRFEPDDARWPLWESISRRAFPGSVSNHHLGSLLGLLVATYEMNHFKDAYQTAVIANAKAFARALAERGLAVAGDPSLDYTETHQVLVEVGYAQGPEVARRLEDSGIICNYQSLPDEEGFTAAGALRLGVAEMTRFGMAAADFGELAELIGDVVLDDRDRQPAVRALRGRFLEPRYCFDGAGFEGLEAQLHALL
ncbi:MAG: glycine cleavage system aminomethyltransferase GcvT [Caldilineae bacterium]|nr:glycine cleavage system aminomethyltransferase GcvT [Chloroflexota bacterium]MCB9176027.1 glycine cleavage system aminomethyltransferase GcvT [Caldilineae bacterium]